jgi:Ca-activated chloride channel homolog
MNKILISIFLLAAFCFVCPAQEADKQAPATLNLIVAGKSGAFVEDLRKEELTLSIDGKPQTILSLEKQQLPLIYGLAIDSTGSMRLMFKDILSAAQTIVNQSQAEEEMMLISFVSADKIRATKEFSADKSSIIKALNALSVEGGATALIDAIYLTVQAVAKHKKDDAKNYRRAVIVITDGEDRDSFHTEKALLELLAKENVQIFFIGLTDDLPADGGFVGKSAKGKSLDFMKKVAQWSGGAVISDKKKNLSDSAASILPLIRTQYVLSYAPIAGGKSDSPKIEIKLAKDSKRKDVSLYFRRQN